MLGPRKINIGYLTLTHTHTLAEHVELKENIYKYIISQSQHTKLVQTTGTASTHKNSHLQLGGKPDYLEILKESRCASSYRFSLAYESS